RDKMNPVYKRFFDIEDSVKANRLETRERATANGWETKIDENGHVISDDAVQKNTTSTIISGKWKKVEPRPDTSGIWMQSAL
ncbi:DNA methylase, partial [human gut metagenome]